MPQAPSALPFCMASVKPPAAVALQAQDLAPNIGLAWYLLTEAFSATLPWCRLALALTPWLAALAAGVGPAGQAAGAVDVAVPERHGLQGVPCHERPRPLPGEPRCQAVPWPPGLLEACAGLWMPLHCALLVACSARQE